MSQTHQRAVVERGLLVDLAAATAFAALTALGARVSLHLPFTPVPVTGQVFSVLLAGAVLGPRLGLVSQAEYLAAGAAGLPVFAHGGGPAAMLGPTGGYLVGFPLAALVVGLCAERLGDRGWRLALGCLCGALVVHISGAAWFGVWASIVRGSAALSAVLSQSLLPFLAVDVVKALAAAAAAPGLRRRLWAA